MADAAHDWTDRRIEELATAIDLIYAKAKGELTALVGELFGDFETENRRWRGLGIAHNLSDALLYAALLAAYALTDSLQLGRGVVGDFALVIDETIGFGEDASVNENVLNQ